MLRRSPLTRSTPLHRGEPLRRNVAVKRRNARRLKRIRSVQFGAQAALCRTLPCCVCTQLRTAQQFPTEAHHWPTRARGGQDCDTGPVCSAHHQELHVVGHDRYFVDLGLSWVGVIERMRRMVADAEQDDELPVSPLLLWQGVGE
jgi:hypothetical protein